MKKYKIEKNIPICELNRKKTSIYPFEEMEISDSFVVPIEKRNSVLGAARNYSIKNKNGFKIQSRVIGNGEFRVWRIA